MTTIPRRTALAGLAGIVAGITTGCSTTMESLPNTERFPAVFLGHGTPMNLINANPWNAAWQALGAQLPRPRAILCISAHWLSQGGTMVTASKSPQMNYDMYGFPQALYDYKYPAPGDPALAIDIESAIRPQTRTQGDSEWGFDHGTWVVMKYLYPKADIPLLQLSIDYSQPPSFHYELAKRLEPLRSKGVLIVGSGNLVHNLGRRNSPDGKPHDWALEFDQRMSGFIHDGNNAAVVNFLNLGSVAKLAHPSYDHFLPLLYVLGAMGKSDVITTICEGFQEPSISMKSFRVG